MKRRLLIAAIVVLIVIAGVAIFLYNSIDSIVKGAIERFGTDVTGTEVSVGSVDISLQSGRGTIRGLKVDNPKGFSSRDAFELGEITVDIDIASLNRDPIVIEEIRIAAPVVRAELDEKARTNVGVIREHVEGYRADTARKSEPKEDSGYEKHFRVLKVTFEEGTVATDATAVGGKEKDITLPPLHLVDVGGTRGAPPAVIGKTIARALLGEATRAATGELKAGLTDKAEEEAKKKLGEILGR